MNDEEDLIFSYTRSQAIADGVLVDVTETAKEAGIKYPTAITSAVFEAYVRVPSGVVAQDEPGRLWDVVWMLTVAITRHAETEGDTLLYTVFVRNDNTGAKPVKLKAVVHPGDEGEPVITVMLPDED
jgi:hypothetical protein